MRWTPGGTSGDVEDRRGSSGGFGGRSIGIGGALILLVLSVLTGRNYFSAYFSGAPATTASAPAGPATESPAEQRTAQFVSFVLDDTQSTWDKVLPAQGVDYRHAKLVLFRDAYPSGCGAAQAATGPFYCPADEKVYLDLGFFDELQRRFGAPGEFAQAYVVAHEIGHHLQKILGVERKVRLLQQQNPSLQNRLSVAMELQADCFAGVWGHSTAQRNLLDPSDVESGLRAAAAVGDDHIQRMSTGRVSPESFTHGSSEQRMQWFRKGFEEGQLAACNTFGGA